MNRRVVIPLETKVREFEGKLWLALNLLARGYEVIIGHKPGLMINLFELEPDIFIDTGAGGSPDRLEIFRTLKKHGTGIVVLDQEGGKWDDDPETWGCRISNELLEYVDHYLTWGRSQRSGVNEYSEFDGDAIIATGDPKFDLLSEKYRSYFDEQAGKLREQYGNYILINTNFGWGNPYDSKHLEEMFVDDDNLREEEPDDLLRFRPFQEKLLQYFLDLIKRGSREFPEASLVLRPHPAENHDVYHQELASIENVYVEQSGNVHPWIHGSEMVIHNCCTTAVEAVCLDKPVLAYMPEPNEEYVNAAAKVPNKLSIEATGEDEALELMGKALNGELGTPAETMNEEQQNLLKSFIDNLNGNGASRICDIIENLPGDGWEGKASNNGKRRVKSMVFRVLGEKNYLRTIEIKNWLIGISEEIGRIEQKFEGIDSNEIHTVLDRLKQLDSAFSDMGIEVNQLKSFDTGYVLQLDESSGKVELNTEK